MAQWAHGPRAAGGRPGRRTGRVGRSPLALCTLAVLSLLGVAGLTALGVWQLERRTWKLDLIDRVEHRLQTAPVPVPPVEAWPAINAERDAYRRVSVAGRFLHDRETLVQAVTDHGGGFWVLTPLRTSAGATILVNRGFVPPDRRDPVTRRDGESPGTVRVSGLMRMTEPNGAFLRANDAKADRWYSRDISAIAAARGLSKVAPFFIDADATSNPRGWPVGGLTVVAFSNNHLVYALTWFALALMLGGATFFVARDEWQLRQGDIDLDVSSGARQFPG